MASSSPRRPDPRPAIRHTAVRRIAVLQTAAKPTIYSGLLTARLVRLLGFLRVRGLLLLSGCFACLSGDELLELISLWIGKDLAKVSPLVLLQLGNVSPQGVDFVLVLRCDRIGSLLLFI